MLNIKPYYECYHEQVLDLILTIQNNEFGLKVTTKDQPDLEKISLIYQNGYGNFWVALYGTKVIGTIALMDIGNSQSVLKKMYVAKKYRGQELGIARFLLDTVFKWCKDNGIKEIYLGTTEFFLAAQKFYERSGFSEITKDKLPLMFPITKYNSKFYWYSIT